MSNNTITLDANDTTARALVDTIRSAVNGTGKYAAYVSAHGVTRENVKHHAAALATFAYPSLKPVQTVDGKRTKYGNAVQAAAAGLRAALPKAETTPDDVLRVTRTGAKSVTVPADHPLYETLVALLAGEEV